MRKFVQFLIALFVVLASTSAFANTLTLVAHGHGTGNTLTIPAGTSDGDLIAVAIHGDCAKLSASFTVVRAMQPTCGNSSSLYSYIRVASSEPSTYAITATAGSDQNYTSWVVYVYRGQSNWAISTLNPTSGGNGGSGTTLTSYGTTTKLANEVYIAFYGWDGSGNNVVTPPAGLGNTDTVNSTSTQYGIFSGDLTQAAVGTISNQQLIITGTPARAYTIGFTIVPTYTGAPSFVGSATGSNTCPMPAGLQSGDFITAFAEDYNRDPGDPTQSGWTRRVNGGGAGTNNSAAEYLWTRTATGSNPTITFSGTPDRQSCITSAYRGISGIDATSSCFTGPGNCNTTLVAPTVTTQNDIVVTVLGAGGKPWSLTDGVGGESSASGGTIPDVLALQPAYFRGKTEFVTNTTWGSALFDLPFYGTATLAPKLNQDSSGTDTGISIALTPSSQPAAGVDVLVFRTQGARVIKPPNGGKHVGGGSGMYRPRWAGGY